MVSKSQSASQGFVFPGSLASVKDKMLEAVSAFTEANERVVGELIDLSSSAARDTLRAYTEFQAAAVEAVRTAPVVGLGQSEGVDDRRDPVTWYQKGIEAVADGTQRVARFIETNAQIVARNAERLQTSAERSAKEIEQAAKTYATRMKEIYSRN